MSIYEEFNDLFQNTPASSQNEDIPAGTYEVQFENVKEDRTSKGYPYVQITYRVVGPIHKGRRLFVKYFISRENPIGIANLKADLLALGVTINEFTDLRLALSTSISDKLIEVKVTYTDKKNGEGKWQNVSIRRLLTGTSAVTESIPF